MAPSPQETLAADRSGLNDTIQRPLDGEEVVISGMSGIFPKSDSTLEFMENLFNKVDMVSDEDPRWIFNHPEVPKHLGKVSGMGKFDAQFFRVHYKQACTMEPMSRKLLEHAYSAIYDSGINPLQLRGKKVGVFIGSTFSESEKTVIYETIQRNGFGITGCNKAMYANRISYWIDGKGPSYAVDIACASSMACIEHAYRSISTGQCDAAIVGGCNLCMHPNVSLNLKRAGFLCLDGKTKCFDKNGDGYVRSDAISVLFVQKAKDAKRIYSEVYHAKGTFSLRADAEFLPIREEKDIRQFLEEFYAGINVSPRDVEYVEACGSGIAEADGNELEAIGKVFGKEKTIKVGSVKSNMGHSEPASGVCALTKVCLAYHKGKLPANLHYYEPQDISSVREGRVEVLQEHTPFGRGFTALNSFSYSGANIHVLLKGNYKPKNLEKYKSSIPRLVLVSGRQDSCVNKILNELKTQPVDAEQIGLLHSIHQYEIPGHMCRGYTILDTNESGTVCLSQKIDYCSGGVRPIWFVYSGMGSQWAGMGTELMKIPTFAAAIERCHQVLQPKGINIVNILTNPDKSIYDNILNSFVGIAAVQIGLTDVLKELGIVPDNIIGHSVGELGCAYADGCFTAEEMILSAYSRGLVSIQTPFIHGSMAAVGLGYKAVLALCPPEIEVACHNSSDSSTISGPAEIMKKFVAELASRGIFAKEVPCSNIAYHSKYIAAAGPDLLKYLSQVIKNPKLRSEKWVSTSVPQDQWNEPKAKYCSADYHTNNLLNSVLFEETARLIPANALVIEIAPHGLLQAILKRSHPECTHIPLTRRGHANSVQFLLEAVGKLYQEGLNPKIDQLYPKIHFPVSTETPMLSQFVEWEHSEDWPQAKYNTKDRVTATAREFVMSIHDDDHKYLKGHVRDGTLVYPEAALLVLVWETLAMQMGADYRDLSVEFLNVHFHGEAHIKTESPLRLCIMIHKGDHKFEVSHNGVEIVSGTIIIAKDHDHGYRVLDQSAQFDKDIEVQLTGDDVYKILKLRGYDYHDNFKTILSSLQSSNEKTNEVTVKWSNDWVSFLDSLIQFNILSNDYDGVSFPKMFKKLSINMLGHKKEKLVNNNGVKGYKAVLHKMHGITRCAGVELDNITFENKPKVEMEPDVIQTRAFVPHFLTGEIDLETALHINLQIIADNIQENNIKITETVGNTSKIIEAIKEGAKIIPDVNFYVNSMTFDNLFENRSKSDSHVFVAENVLKDEKKMKNLHEILSKNTFVLTIEDNASVIQPRYKLFHVISAISQQKKILVLLKKSDLYKVENITFFPIQYDNKFSWLTMVKSELTKTRKVVLVSERQNYCGLLGLIKKLAMEHKNKIGLLVLDDYLAPSFNPESKSYKDQLEKNLTINVLKKGKWGGYYYLRSKTSSLTWNVQLTSSVPGNIDSLTWTEASVIPASYLKIQVCYTGPSFRDAQKAVGNIKTESKTFGMDFSGIDYQGEKVMGVLPDGAIASTLMADADLLWPVPTHWNLEEAATVPLPYLHAYYCLAMKDPVHKNWSVFVNAGAGAFGQAVISVCLSINCTVYTTVSTLEKKLFLLRLFPQLKEENITFSRHDTFYTAVIENSKGLKCHKVLSSLSGPLRAAATKCVAPSGIFTDISETDMIKNKGFGMFFLCEERNYKAANLANLFKPENADERKKLQLLIAEGIAKGIVKPLSRVVYSPNEVSKAFRLLSSSKHRGRVLIRMRDHVTMNQGLSVKPAVRYSPNTSHVVICDENGFGLELVERLIKQGATKIVLHLKPSYMDGYCRIKIARWRAQNIEIITSTENLQTESGCTRLLTQSLNQGPTEGLFVVKDNKRSLNFEQNNFVNSFNNTSLVVANLDLVSRKVCVDLKHFVVITRPAKSAVDAYTTSLLEKICQTRCEVGLPSTVFHAPSIIEFDDITDNSQTNVEPQTLSTVFNALEISLKLKYDNIMTFNLKKNLKDNYLQKVSNILGVAKIEELPRNLTLEDLNCTDVNIEEIKALLKLTHNINLSNAVLRNMTVETLNSFDKDHSENTNFSSGLGAFYTYIDEDECLATEPMVAMPTKLSNATEKEEELDPKASYLMLLPGFEGHHQIFYPVCERLKVLAMTLQLGPDVLNDSIQEMAINIMKFMKKRFELKSKFYLLGYSFGVNVALELAALMEKEGHVGVVYCLDSSPDALKVQLDAYLGNVTDAQLQDMIVEHMYKLMTGQDGAELRKDLDGIENWNDKVEACVNRLRGLVNYSHQYKRSILKSAYNRIKLARKYTPNFKLESEIVLMKGIAHPKAQNLPNDYNLSKYTNQPVKVFNIESDHALAPKDCRVSNIVNKLLDSKVLEDFKNKNLCETYLADPFKIL